MLHQNHVRLARPRQILASHGGGKQSGEIEPAESRFLHFTLLIALLLRSPLSTLSQINQNIASILTACYSANFTAHSLQSTASVVPPRVRRWVADPISSSSSSSIGVRNSRTIVTGTSTHASSVARSFPKVELTVYKLTWSRSVPLFPPKTDVRSCFSLMTSLITQSRATEVR